MFGRDRSQHPAPPRASAAAPTPASPAAVAEALVGAPELWTAPRTGEVQLGAAALCGGRAPRRLAGMQLWPALTRSGPALVLGDAHRRVRVVVDVEPAIAAPPRRLEWVPAGTVAPLPRMPGSHRLWRRWQPELIAAAAHEWGPACEEHAHVSRAGAQGQLVAGIPRHDAWVMTRAWLPEALLLPDVSDVHWVLLSASDQPARGREPLLHSHWDAVSYAELAGVLARWRAGRPAPAPGIAAVLQLVLPGPSGP